MRAALSWSFILMIAAGAFAATAQSPHDRVECAGIDEPQTAAIAETLSAARDVYVAQLKFDLPDASEWYIVSVSIIGTPGMPGEPFNAGDWMIRVELDRKRDRAATGE